MSQNNRIPVGATVEVVGLTPGFNREEVTVGMRGILERDDNSDRPYRVRLAYPRRPGQEIHSWFLADQIRLVEPTPMGDTIQENPDEWIPEGMKITILRGDHSSEVEPHGWLLRNDYSEILPYAVRMKRKSDGEYMTFWTRKNDIVPYNGD